MVKEYISYNRESQKSIEQEMQCLPSWTII